MELMRKASLSALQDFMSQDHQLKIELHLLALFNYNSLDPQFERSSNDMAL